MERNNDIRRATWWLKNDVIPTIAHFWGSLDKNVLQIFPLPVFLHAYGINLRYLGLFAKHLRKMRWRHQAPVITGAPGHLTLKKL